MLSPARGARQPSALSPEENERASNGAYRAGNERNAHAAVHAQASEKHARKRGYEKRAPLRGAKRRNPERICIEHKRRARCESRKNKHRRRRRVFHDKLRQGRRAEVHFSRRRAAVRRAFLSRTDGNILKFLVEFTKFHYFIIPFFPFAPSSSVRCGAAPALSRSYFLHPAHMYHYCTIAALFFSSKHGGKIWSLLPYRDERGRNRKKAHARQEIFPGRRCGVSTRPARLSLQTQRMAGAKAKGESAPGRESEPQSGSDPMRGNEPEAGG